jgi:RNA polymerase sigma-70 factor (ECF subfamily)
MLDATAIAAAQRTESDEVLAARARDGARSAFAVLVTRYQDRVYRLALRMSRNPSDAEEITQETFLLAHRGIRAFEGESRFGTWLYRIAVNQALMRRRAAKRRPVESLDALLPQLAHRALAATYGEPMAATDELVHRVVLARRVRDALEQLDEAHRAAVVLRDLEELSAEDAAIVLGITPAAVRQRAHRARLKLREELADLLAVPSVH